MSCAFTARCPRRGHGAAGWARGGGEPSRGSGSADGRCSGRSTGACWNPTPTPPAGTPMPRAVIGGAVGDRDLFMECPPRRGNLRRREVAHTSGARHGTAGATLFRGPLPGIPSMPPIGYDGLGELSRSSAQVGRVEPCRKRKPGTGFPIPPRAHAPRRPACRCDSFDERRRAVAGRVREQHAHLSRRRDRLRACRPGGRQRARVEATGEVADIDGDGGPEAVFADEWGDLVVFRVGASSVETLAVQAMEHPQSGKFLKITGTAPAELLAWCAVEAAPARARIWSSLARPCGCRGWRGRGAARGTEPRRRRRVSTERGRATSRRGTLGRLAQTRAPPRCPLRADSLEWAGELRCLVAGTRRWRGVLWRLGFNVIWMGGAADARGEERVTTGILSAPRAGLRPPRVASASRIPEGQRLVLAWEGEGCDAPTMTMTRAGAPPRNVSVEGLIAVDTLALGVTATYEVRSTDCVWPTLTVTALEPSPPPALEWDGPARVLASFARPLGAAPHDVRLRGETGDILPVSGPARSLGDEARGFAGRGRRARFAPPDGSGGHGRPARGGTWDLALPLPPSPAEATPVLADIEYFAGPLPRLIVHVRPAFFDSCDAPFVLEPGGLLPRLFAHFLYPPGVILALDEPCAPEPTRSASIPTACPPGSPRSGYPGASGWVPWSSPTRFVSESPSSWRTSRRAPRSRSWTWPGECGLPGG